MPKPSRDATAVARFLTDHAAYLEMKDLRVGQFISNVAQFMGYDGDCFYIENDALVAGMRKFIIEMQKAEMKT